MYAPICHKIVYWILYVKLSKQAFSFKSLLLFLLSIYHTYFDYLLHLSHIDRIPHSLVTSTHRAHSIFPRLTITMPSLPRRHEYHVPVGCSPITRPGCSPIPTHLLLKNCSLDSCSSLWCCDCTCDKFGRNI